MKHYIVIPVFNDWKSLKKLISNLNFILKSNNKFQNSVIIINDNSTEKINISLKKFRNFKQIKIINLKENLGSQKAIAVGLKFLKKIKGDCIITVMDGDGEDNPKQVRQMLEMANNNPNFVITSNRKKRQEPFLIVFLYKLHLFITFIFTLKWISFGNFTSFHKNNLDSLLSNNKSWYAHSSSVKKNCKIISQYAERKKRYFGKSKLGLTSLIEHSLRVNAVFLVNIFFSSIFYLILINYFLFFSKMLKIILSVIVITYLLSVFIIALKHWVFDLSKILRYIKNVSLIKAS